MRLTDRIRKKTSRLGVPTVLEAVKERLVELSFNIDNYDISSGRIEARRNRLDKIVLGLYRRAWIEVRFDPKKEDLVINVRWGGLYSAVLLTGIWFFAISLAVLKDLGLRGVMLSFMLGLLGISMNLIFFYIMRVRFLRMVKRDLLDLESHHREG